MNIISRIKQNKIKIFRERTFNIMIKERVKLLILFLTGGFIYGAIEVAYKGNTHISMFITGGLCFILTGGLNSYWDRSMPLLKQMALSGSLITCLEFICGCIVNLWLDLNVWDYSRLPFNLSGQICLLFTVIWFFLSLIAIFLDDLIRWKLFGENMPRYVILRRKNTGAAPADR